MLNVAHEWKMIRHIEAELSARRKTRLPEFEIKAILSLVSIDEQALDCGFGEETFHVWRR